MVKRAAPDVSADSPPWQTKKDGDDFATGRTEGRDWDWHDGLVAQMAVAADRARRVEDMNIKTALRVVSELGLGPFVRLYFRERYAAWRWGISLCED